MSVNPLDIFANKPVISKQSVSVEEDFIFHYRHDLPGELEAPGGLTHHLVKNDYPMGNRFNFFVYSLNIVKVILKLHHNFLR